MSAADGYGKPHGLPEKPSDPGWQAGAERISGAAGSRQANNTVRANGSKGKAPARPQTICGNIHNLPSAWAALVGVAHWVVWRWEWVESKLGGKWTKVPYRPSKPAAKARNNDPTTWSTYPDALAAFDAGGFDGIGFCLQGTDFVMLDLDSCRDPVSGKIAGWAQAVVDRAGSYTEITVSGTGLRIIGTGTGPKLHRKQTTVNGGSLETYRNAPRYVVVTGNPLKGTASHLAQLGALADGIVAELDAKKKAAGSVNADKPGDAAGLNLEYIIRTGDASRWDNDRSKAVYYVANELIRRGESGDAVLAILLNPSNGISAHIYDQSNPKAYAKRQVEKAVKESTGTVPRFDRVVVTRDGEEARWTITIDTEEIVVSSTEVLNQRALIDRCFVFGVQWAPLSRSAWSAFLRETYANAEKRTEVGVSKQEQFHELLADFLCDRRWASTRDEILLGKPWENEKLNRHEFRMKDLERFISMNGTPALRQESRSQLGDRIKRLGGGKIGGESGTSIKGHSVRLWWVPLAVARPTPRIDVRPYPKSPI